MARGSCLCGAVRFEIDNDGVVLAVGCFCVSCRKVSGSQFGVYLQVRPSRFRWLAGEDATGAYESSPGNKRAFCKTCGSVAPISTSYGAVRVPGGALDGDPAIVPDAILFEASKARWCTAGQARHTFADAGPREYWACVVSQLYGTG